MSNSPKLLSEHTCFGGTLGFYSHLSQACNSEMKLAVYLPPQAALEPVPVLYFLSGLTCTQENFMAKAGAQRYAAEHGLMLVVPDTSPRDTGIPGEDDDWTLGSGAGFYIDAMIAPWNQYYQMYSYVVKELPDLIAAHFPVRRDRVEGREQVCQGIFGHSMGGHGALICALRNPHQYRSVSAFAPICAPSQCPWGQHVFTQYLGTDLTTWNAYDASELVLHQQLPQPILIDQGSADQFLDAQLMPHVFEQACHQAGQPLTLRIQPRYDHSYYFIATFIADHIEHHAAILYGQKQ
ncbi:S-formylglutathione hydrolase [Pantanalinema sp. GBBB05]|uniref:S-formylglutathione hydrolase n=1 Tax=Pantanalinema sp. GBBB05 TaxID=2604139 RepID=UPI001DC1B350|nr:S-formylglutathione hydrolase [Pantanalinema sp. GBBB05]